MSKLDEEISQIKEALSSTDVSNDRRLLVVAYERLLKLKRVEDAFDAIPSTIKKQLGWQ